MADLSFSAKNVFAVYAVAFWFDIGVLQKHCLFDKCCGNQQLIHKMLDGFAFEIDRGESK